MLKKMLAIVLALTFVFSLAACGQEAEVAPTNAPVEAPVDTPAETDATPVEDKEETLSGTLEIWSSGEELGRFVEGFNKIYPDVTVNITVVPNLILLRRLLPLWPVVRVLPTSLPVSLTMLSIWSNPATGMI